ncbi:MAG: S-layer homology domain-containing protein [Synergistaceae bacterium]|nr:S-layer homology domain-containing protein [Synergistaceae bacterium]
MKKVKFALAPFVLLAFVFGLLCLPAEPGVFSEVPTSHRAYDALEQLAGRGIVAGYPDGSFRGTNPITRYEAASIIARALENVNLDTVDEEDMELVRRLASEFRGEMDALLAKTYGLNRRIFVLENDIGGWTISGEFRFDAKFGQSEGHDWYGDDSARFGTEFSGKNEFDLNRYRIFLRKRISEYITFHSRLGAGNAHNGDGAPQIVWEQYYVTMPLSYTSGVAIGRQTFDIETQLGFSGDNNPLLGNWTMNMFSFRKDWGAFSLSLMAGRVNDGRWGTVLPGDPNFPLGNIEYYLVGGQLDVRFNGRLRGGVVSFALLPDESVPLPVSFAAPNGESETDVLVWAVYGGYAFTPDIELKGVYYREKLGKTFAFSASGGVPDFDDGPSAWKVILDVKQDALKYTSAWLEYGKIDNNFITNDRLNLGTGGIGGLGGVTWSGAGASLLWNMPADMKTTTTYGIRLEQKWNDKWRSFIRYYAADFGTPGIGDARNWTVGAAYRLNPAVEFELAYDVTNYGGTGVANLRNGSDDILRFRTFVTF